MIARPLTLTTMGDTYAALRREVADRVDVEYYGRPDRDRTIAVEAVFTMALTLTDAELRDDPP